MSRGAESIEITDNAERHRYEVLVDDAVAGFLEYSVDGEVVTMPHTVVDPAFSGRGLAGMLARRALDDAAAAGRTVVPTCSFVARWITKHPEYERLVRH
ncbi:Yjdj-type Gcn5-related N-acetyltransferase (GNAT) domain profile [Propionibacterium ruminifibrarum]|uniref:Yjdj-type Gcn5-related N-acetyltransferase (GNAT) domain profile n=1 Tax=Propionibacterium ruminifibrarum TaxID=1962131 RepID=A0A375I1G5_9ACTN|nr:GNAT family N-acetyltransferase [Propionibacterium ruminifibrarum]SPF67240.1 Yjdj-type Gcn5-related N-acetyltransferase (GNAT) domain profile [Propionibacterium ruminifibrarum]